MARDSKNIRPFLREALDKDPSERSIFEKIGVAIYGPGIEARADRDKPPAVLDEEYRSFIEELPGEVQADVDRYLDIFKNDPTPVIEFLDEYKDKGYSDYFKNSSKFADKADKNDLGRYADFNFLGKGGYDALYRDDEAGEKARKKVMESKLVQAQLGPGVGLYTGVRGTAELLSALSDLYLDTETLDNVQKVLPEIDLNEVYGNEAGGVAKFTSLMTQYGTGFAVAQKIAKKIFGKAVDNKLAKKAAAAAAKNKVTQSGVNLAKFGGYWVLPAFAADTTVSATGQKSVGDIFGDEQGNFLERALANTQLENLEGITDPKEYAAAVLRNKLKFGAEGTAFMGALSLVGPAFKGAVKGTGLVTTKVVGPTLTGASKLLASEASQLPKLFRAVSKGIDKGLSKTGIPDSDLWKFSEYGLNIKTSMLRAIDSFTQNFKSGGPFNVQARNELKRLDGLNKAAKKNTDIFMKDLDREMYKLANAGFSDILFNSTATNALRQWGKVLDFMKGNIKLNDLPKSLQSSSFAIKNLIDKYTKELAPIIKTTNVKDDLIKTWVDIYIHRMKYLRTQSLELTKKHTKVQ